MILNYTLFSLVTFRFLVWWNNDKLILMSLFLNRNMLN